MSAPKSSAAVALIALIAQHPGSSMRALAGSVGRDVMNTSSMLSTHCTRGAIRKTGYGVATRWWPLDLTARANPLTPPPLLRKAPPKNPKSVAHGPFEITMREIEQETGTPFAQWPRTMHAVQTERLRTLAGIA